MFVTVSMAVAIGYSIALFSFFLLATKNKKIAPKVLVYSIISLFAVISLAWFTVGVKDHNKNRKCDSGSGTRFSRGQHSGWKLNNHEAALVVRNSCPII